MRTKTSGLDREKKRKRKSEGGGRREGNISQCYVTCIHYVTISSISLTAALCCKFLEKEMDLVPVQVKSCDFCIVSLKVREVVEVIIGFLISFLPARERKSQTKAP